MEQSQNLHLLISLLSLYLFLIFAWWWTKQGAATTIYGITCFLMLGLFATHSGAWWIYEQLKCGKKPSEILEWYIYIRHYFVLIPLVLYAIHITRKACFGKDLYYGRRKDDR